MLCNQPLGIYQEDPLHLSPNPQPPPRSHPPSPPSQVYPTHHPWIRMHILYSRVRPSVHLTSFHLSHFQTQVNSPENSFFCSKLLCSLKDTESTREVQEAQISSQKHKQHERESQSQSLLFPKPTSPTEMYTDGLQNTKFKRKIINFFKEFQKFKKGLEITQ